TAASMRRGFGMYSSSRLGANGTGVCGQVTVLIGAFSASNALSAMMAATSAASEQRGGLSSTSTSLPVFSTLSMIVSSSSGEVVLGSITSALMPSLASV